MGKLIIVMGVTASGKDTLLNRLVKLGVPRMVSCTTRPKRVGETEGVHYHFVDKDTFDDDLSNDRIIEHREYNVANGETWYYYFKKDEIDLSERDYCCIADVKGTADLVNYFGRANTVVVWLNTPLDVCIERAIGRDGASVATIKETCRRMVSDIEEFIESGRAEELCDLGIPFLTSDDMYDIEHELGLRD